VLDRLSPTIAELTQAIEREAEKCPEAQRLTFEELIRRLVISSLAGKNVEAATALRKKALQLPRLNSKANKNIDALLGVMEESSDEISYPQLAEIAKSMEPQEFVLAAMSSLGTQLIPESDGIYASKRDGKVDRICFDDIHSSNAVLYRPGTAPFSRLVSRIVATGLHDVQDADDKPRDKGELMTRQWVESFGGKLRLAEIQDVTRSFNGTAIVRVRATVGHDSYERLVNVKNASLRIVDSCGLDWSWPDLRPTKES
jgi:hypothetical protein